MGSSWQSRPHSLIAVLSVTPITASCCTGACFDLLTLLCPLLLLQTPNDPMKEQISQDKFGKSYDELTGGWGQSGRTALMFNIQWVQSVKQLAATCFWRPASAFCIYELLCLHIKHMSVVPQQCGTAVLHLWSCMVPVLQHNFWSALPVAGVINEQGR
jgi:hypothetical protein